MVQDISAAAPADRSSALTRRIWRRALIGLGASVATPFIAAALFTGGLWLTALLVGRPDPVRCLLVVEPPGRTDRARLTRQSCGVSLIWAVSGLILAQ